MTTASFAIDRWERTRREQRDLRRGVVGSVVGHVVLGLILVDLPTRTLPPLPAVVSVDLVAAVPRRAVPRAAPKAPAPRPPAAKPVALPPQQKKKVLPRTAPEPRAKPKPPALDYDSALSSLRDELGEPALEAEAVVDLQPAAPPTGGRADPVLAAWQLAVNRAIARSWVTPMAYRDSPLRTLLVVTVMADGRVLGEPAVRRSSGDPQFDDNAIRAVLGASPLPPPPTPGDWPFLFNPND